MGIVFCHICMPSRNFCPIDILQKYFYSILASQLVIINP
jgi:hypothetical protein